MDFDVDTFEKISAFLFLPLIPPAAYCFLYAAFRCLGTLRVGRDGWHAGELALGGSQLLPAFRLFELFHPMMRAESAARSRIGGDADAAKEPGVSDVVVELVRMA